MSYSLIDGVARAAANPDTFQVPSDEEKNGLMVGDFVRIGIQFAPTVLPLLHPTQPCESERPWAIVTEVSPVGIHVEVNNDLIATHVHGLKCGDMLVIEPRHILSILKAEPVEAFCVWPKCACKTNVGCSGKSEG